MTDNLVINTGISAYFIWEYTNHSTALDLWYCAEDIALFFENSGIISIKRADGLVRLSRYDLGYVEFVRHIAFRVFYFTSECDSNKNWFTAERLLANKEWLRAVVSIAAIYNNIRNGDTQMADLIRSDKIKKYILH